MASRLEADFNAPPAPPPMTAGSAQQSKRRTRTMTPKAIEALAKATAAAAERGPETKRRNAEEAAKARAAAALERKRLAEEAAAAAAAEAAAVAAAKEQRRLAKQQALEALATHQKEMADEIRTIKERWVVSPAQVEGPKETLVSAGDDLLLSSLKRRIEPIAPPTIATFNSRTDGVEAQAEDPLHALLALRGGDRRRGKRGGRGDITELFGTQP